MLINLVMNAAEATPANGWIVVRTSAGDNDTVVLEIQDSGSGILPKYLHRIYDPFFSTKEAGKGVGLGLAVVYGIIDAHEGTITVDSEQDVGTTFTVTLPANGSRKEHQDEDQGSAR